MEYGLISVNDKFCPELSILKYIRYKYINHKKINELLKCCSTPCILELMIPYEKLIKVAYKEGKYNPTKEVRLTIDKIETMIFKRLYTYCLDVFNDKKLLDTIIFYVYFISRFSGEITDTLESNITLFYEFKVRNEYYPYDLFLENLIKWNDELKEGKK